MHLGEGCSSYPVIGCGDHQSVWHQEGRFGLLDVSDGHDWDGNLGPAGIRRNYIRTLNVLVYRHQVDVETQWEALDKMWKQKTSTELRGGALPLCLCQKLWNGSRSSGRRQTFVPGRGCLSAGRRCNLRNGKAFGEERTRRLAVPPSHHSGWCGAIESAEPHFHGFFHSRTLKVETDRRRLTLS